MESKTSFNLAEEHPSHKYMIMSKRTKFVVPSITHTYLFPNLKELCLECQNTEDVEVLEKREREVWANSSSFILSLSN